MVLGAIGIALTGGWAAPALTPAYALLATAQVTGVAALVTGGIGTFTPDRVAQKNLAIASTFLGVASMLAGAASILAGSSKWVTGAAKVVDNRRTITLPDFSFNTRRLRFTNATDDFDDVSLDLFTSRSADASTQTPPIPPPKPGRVSFKPQPPTSPPKPTTSDVSTMTYQAAPTPTPTPTPAPQSQPAVVVKAVTRSKPTESTGADDEFLRLITASKGIVTSTAKTKLAGENVVKKLHLIKIKGVPPR